MSGHLSPSAFRGLAGKLQQLGLNAYESRTYIVLVGYSPFKALDLAARAHVPRQKIYDVLQALIEKGFVRVVQEKTKLFRAIEPHLAIPAFLAGGRQRMEQELAEKTRVGMDLVEELSKVDNEASGRRECLEHLEIIAEPRQSSVRHRRMLAEVSREYVELIRPPYASEPEQDAQLIVRARRRGVACRLVVDQALLETGRPRWVELCVAEGIEVRQAARPSLKLALFDRCRGLVAVADSVITKPGWTSLVFDHPALGEAAREWFELRWGAAVPVTAADR